MDYSEPKKGTTTVGILCEDGVILASEKRATMGNLIANKNADKVLKIQDHIGMTIAGLVGDAQVLARIMRVQTALYETERNKPISLEAAATLFSNVLLQQRYFPYWVQILFGGYDSKPRLYSLDASGAVLEEKYVSSGSGSPTAYGVLEDSFVEGKMIKDNLPIAVRAIRAAMERDSFSGNGVTIAIIDKKGFRKLTQKEIEAITK